MATKRIGILTAGGDAPGLNAAIRGFGKAAIGEHGWKLIGFRDGMRGLAENRFIELDGKALSGATAQSYAYGGASGAYRVKVTAVRAGYTSASVYSAEFSTS